MLKNLTCIFHLQNKLQDQYRLDFKKMLESKKLEAVFGLVNVQFMVAKCGTLKMMLNVLSEESKKNNEN